MHSWGVLGPCSPRRIPDIHSTCWSLSPSSPLSSIPSSPRNRQLAKNHFCSRWVFNGARCLWPHREAPGREAERRATSELPHSGPLRFLPRPVFNWGPEGAVSPDGVWVLGALLTTPGLRQVTHKGRGCLVAQGARAHGSHYLVLTASTWMNGETPLLCPRAPPSEASSLGNRHPLHRAPDRQHHSPAL